MTSQSQPMPPSQAARASGDPTVALPAVEPGPVPDGATSTGTGWGPAREEPRQAPPAPASRTRSRRARLVLARVDPWSVMKLSFMFSIALAIVAVVAVAVVWYTIESMGVFSAVDRTVAELLQAEGGEDFRILDYVGFDRVLGVTTIVACVNIVLVTALATLGAFLYNLMTSLVGGLNVTLSENS